MKYILFFMGGNPKAEEKEMKMKEWGDWIMDLKKKGVFESGFPLESGGKMVSMDGVTDTMKGDGSIEGYIVIEAESEAEAVEIAKMAPHMVDSGKTVVRGIMDMKM